MKWTKMTNEELVLHLELWLEVDGQISTSSQKDFFEEVMWRLQMSETRLKENI